MGKVGSSSSLILDFDLISSYYPTLALEGEGTEVDLFFVCRHIYPIRFSRILQFLSVMEKSYSATVIHRLGKGIFVQKYV